MDGQQPHGRLWVILAVIIGIIIASPLDELILGGAIAKWWKGKR